MKFAERLKLVMKERAVSNSELARRLDVSPGTITNYLAADREPDLERIEKIAEALEVSPAYLLGWSQQERVLNAIGASSAIANALPGTQHEKTHIFNETIKQWNIAQRAILDARQDLQAADDAIALALAHIQRKFRPESKPNLTEIEKAEAGLISGLAKAVALTPSPSPQAPSSTERKPSRGRGTAKRSSARRASSEET